MEVWFAKARELADGDPRLLAWAEVYAGLGRTDQADYAGAVTAFQAATEHARSADEWRALAYALTGTGRLRLLRRELPAARGALTAACATARQAGYTSFLAFPGSLLAEVDLLGGRLGNAAAAFEDAYSLVRQVGDPCWESYALRGRGLLAAVSGDDALALDLLVQAPQACRRQRHAHDWVQAHCLDALAGFAAQRNLDRAPGWVDELESFASRRGMRELVARAALHRVALGQPGAEDVASLLLETVDNPALRDLSTQCRGPPSPEAGGAPTRPRRPDRTAPTRP